MTIITCNTSSLVNFSPFESTASYSPDQTVNCGKEASRVIILSPAANFATPDRAHGLQPAEGAREDQKCGFPSTSRRRWKKNKMHWAGTCRQAGAMHTEPQPAAPWWTASQDEVSGSRACTNTAGPQLSKQDSSWVLTSAGLSCWLAMSTGPSWEAHLHFRSLSCTVLPPLNCYNCFINQHPLLSSAYQHFWARTTHRWVTRKP